MYECFTFVCGKMVYSNHNSLNRYNVEEWKSDVVYVRERLCPLCGPTVYSFGYIFRLLRSVFSKHVIFLLYDQKVDSCDESHYSWSLCTRMMLRTNTQTHACTLTCTHACMHTDRATVSMVGLRFEY